MYLKIHEANKFTSRLENGILMRSRNCMLSNIYPGVLNTFIYFYTPLQHSRFILDYCTCKSGRNVLTHSMTPREWWVVAFVVRWGWNFHCKPQNIATSFSLNVLCNLALFHKN